MGFVRIVHTNPDIAPAVVSERAAMAYAKRGWQLEELVNEPTPVDDVPQELARPQKNDSTAIWRTYAVALGADNGGLSVTKAFDMSRDDLVAMYTADDPKPTPTPKARSPRKRAAAPQRTSTPKAPAADPPKTSTTSTAPAKTPDTTKES